MAAKSVYEILLQVSGGKQAKMDLASVDTQLKQLEEASNRLQLVTQALDRVGGSLSAVGTQFLEFSDHASRLNAEMERGLTNLGNIAGMTTEQLGSYNSELASVMETTGYQISRNDLLTSSYDAASAGFTEAGDALGVLGASAQLAIAGNSGLAAATDNMASSQKAVIAGVKSYAGELSVYGDVASQASVVSEKMYKIIKLGITDVKQLAPEFAELAPLAQAAGMSLDELSASYAASTSAGIKTTITTTNLKALISSIARGGGTEEAKQMIASLGLSFDTAALKTEGLVGILQNLKDNGIDTLDEYLKLTGSVEAANALAALSAQDFAGKLDYVKNAAVDVQSMVDTLSSDPLGRMTEATNRWNAELQLAGENLAPVRTIALELGIKVLEAFNQLPAPLQDAIGSLVVIGGVAGKGIGAILNLVSQIATATLSYKIWQAELTKTVMLQSADASSKGIQTAATLKLASAKGVLLGVAGKLQGVMLTQIPTFGALSGGIATLSTTVTASTAVIGVYAAGIAALAAAVLMAIKHLQNLKLEAENDKLFGKLQETEPIVRGIEKVVAEMRKTGKALPQEELDKWVNLAREAQGESDVLEGHIRALTNANEKAKQGITGASAAQAEQTVGTNKAAASVDTLKAAEEKRLEIVGKLKDALETGLAVVSEKLEAQAHSLAKAQESGKITIDDYYRALISGASLAQEGTRSLYEEMLSSSKISSGERKDLEIKLTQEMRGHEQERLGIIKEYQQQRKQAAEEAFGVLKDQLKVKAAEEKWSTEALNDELEQLEANRARSRAAQIEGELRTVKAGSLKAKDLAIELWRIRGELATKEIADREAAEEAKSRAAEVSANKSTQVVQDAQREQTQVVQDAKGEQEGIAKKSQEEQERIAREEEQARKDAWDRETSYFNGQLDLREASARLAAEQLKLDLDLGGELDSLAGDALDSTEGLFNSINANLEEQRGLEDQIAQLRAKGGELTQEEAIKLQGMTEDLSKLQETQRLLNSEKNSSLNLLGQMGVKIQGNLGQEELQLQIAQARLDLEIKQMQNKLIMLKLETDLNMLAQDTLILEQERLLLSGGLDSKEAEIARGKIANAQKTKELLQDQLELTREMTNLEASLATSKSRIKLAERGINPGSSVGRGGGSTKVSLAREDLDKLNEANKKLGSSLETSNSGLMRGLEASRVATEMGTSGIADSVGALGGGVTQVGSEISSGFGSNIQATQAQTQELKDQLAALERATRELPGAIAAQLPRPPAPIRSR
jgi:hypothetical protein